MRKSLLLPLLIAAGCLASSIPARAEVVRLAPEFTIPAAGDKAKSLKSFRGQAVVLLIADSTRNGDFKKQVRYLEDVFAQFASKHVIFVAAVRDASKPIKSNIPFALANNPDAVASSYGTSDRFNIVIIGRDGNVDYQTKKVCTGERVRDVIQNAFPVQTSARKQ